MDAPYTPVDCGFHDGLLALATLRRPVAIDLVGATEADPLRGRIVDVFSRDGAEYLRLDGGAAVRLDHIVAVRDEEGGKTIQPPSATP